MSEISKKSPLVWLTALVLLVTLMAVTAPAPVRAANFTVTSGLDSGPGSFRQAIADANADTSINVIKFDEGLTVNLSSTVTYTGSQDLTIDGKGSTISGVGVAKAPTWDEALFRSLSDADLTLRGLSFVDSFGTGVAVLLPEDATGIVAVSLNNVTIDSATFHGLLIDGQAYNGFNTDDIAHPACVDPWFYDSAAGIKLTIKKSSIVNNGQIPAGYDTGATVVPVPGNAETDGLSGCPADFDGVRVDDGGLGGIEAHISDSHVDGNLADGLEYDETGDGTISSAVTNSTFNGNGDTEAYANALAATDFDDGFDIDETGPGDIIASFVNVDASANFDEGIDLDEADSGSVWVTGVNVQAIGNEDEGLKVDEENDGDISLTLTNSKINGTASQQGIEMTEESDGDLVARITNSEVKNNDNDGINLTQESSGTGSLRVVNSDLSGNGGDGATDLDGVTESLTNVAT